MSDIDTLPAVSREFIAHFGEMGSRWGINRTVGQIYALLYLSPRALSAEDIVLALGFSRSNVSMGLKELQAWRLVRLRHQAGERREFFEAPEDVWEIFRVLAEERRRREVEPTLSMLRGALQGAPGSDQERYALDRMRAMYDLISLLLGWFDEMQKLSPDTARKLMGMGTLVSRALDFKERVGGARAKAGKRPAT
ncbi:MAG: GbsR/MarR family transcriptional regulator [Gammaproteobacteria bacterium]